MGGRVVCEGVPDAILDFTTHLQVDPTPLKAKPSNHAAVVERLKEPSTVCEITVRELAELLANGGTFMPSICPDKNSKSWQSCSGFCIDIDNDQKQKDRGYLTLMSKDAVKRATEYGLCPVLVYETFNPKNESERYRMVFLLADEVTDREQFDRMAAKMLDLFPDADESTVDDYRHFYGTDKRVLVMPGAQILPAEEFAARLDKVERMPPNDPGYKAGDDTGGGNADYGRPDSGEREGNGKKASVADSDGGTGKQPSNRDVRMVKSMLAIIPVSKLGHDPWVKIGMALHSAGFGCEVWDEWSKSDTRQDGHGYEAGLCEKKWKTFEDDKDKAVSIGFLKDMAYRLGWMPENPPEVTGFYFSHGWLYERSNSRNGYDKRLTPTPPYILADIVDVDTNARRALVGVTIEEGYKKPVEHTVVLDREVLFNHTQIVNALVSTGAVITSTNARGIVEYLKESDGATWAANRPRYKSVSHMGWAGEPLGAFMPYDQFAEGVDVRFDAKPDAAALAIPFLAPKGTLEEWVAGMEPARDSMAFRAIMAASFASPLVPVLQVQAFIVYLWGPSHTGKTPSMKAGGSVWGCPSGSAAGSYYRTFADTPKAITKTASFYHNVPMIIDEFQTKDAGRSGGQRGRQDSATDLLYNLSQGHERAALNQDRSFKAYSSWNLLVIATGEVPISNTRTQQGALNRTLEINAAPFDDEREASNMHRFVTEQYGTAGREYVKRLQGFTVARLKDGFESVRESVLAVVGGCPQAENIALLVFADVLADTFIFKRHGEWGESLADALEMAKWLADNTGTARERDTGRQAIEELAGWMARENSHFIDAVENVGVVGAPSPVYGKYATFKGRRVCYIIKSEFDRMLEDAGYSPRQVLGRMKDESIIHTEQNGESNTVVRDIGIRHARCVCIFEDKLSEFLDGPQPVQTRMEETQV